MTMKCAAHPDIETSLKCGKCGTPICPRCMVQTPVGARCPRCADVRKLPTFSVSGGYYLRGGGAALGMGVVTGLAWGAIDSIMPYFYLGLILAAAVGYAIAEVASLSVNRKRGLWLAMFGGAAVVISYLVNIFTFGGLPYGALRIIIDLLAIGIGISVVISRLR
ncbi:MAG TPA: hypothetical protein G4O16_00950 [Dehalococcoidia bacterium]|nr:hypothetical protein [Dehalococcoidia bacterium]